MNLVLDFEFFSIAVTYHIKEVCEIKFIDYLIKSSISESVYAVIKYSFECQQKVSEVSIQSFF